VCEDGHQTFACLSLFLVIKRELIVEFDAFRKTYHLSLISNIRGQSLPVTKILLRSAS
jgi:hypothetical protein